jgi:hypothetical protein
MQEIEVRAWRNLEVSLIGRQDIRRLFKGSICRSKDSVGVGCVHINAAHDERHYALMCPL